MISEKKVLSTFYSNLQPTQFSNIFTQNEPDKAKNLAYVVNDQLHDIRDAIKTVDKKLEKKAKLEIPLERLDDFRKKSIKYLLFQSATYKIHILNIID
jgi:peptide methionine sulfoxide reductase MsrA